MHEFLREMNTKVLNNYDTMTVGELPYTPDPEHVLRYVSDAGLQMASNRSLLCFDARGIASTAGSCESGDAKVIFSDGVTADTVSTTILGKVLR